MNAVVKVVVRAAAETVGQVRMDLDAAHSAVDDIVVLLEMAREQCQWTLADVEQSRQAQARLHLLIEAALQTAGMVHNDTDVLGETLKDVRKGLEDLQVD